MSTDSGPILNTMQATFSCPGCDKTYPSLPTLVGRPVRCSQCHQIFRLRADGIADLIQAPAPQPEPAVPSPVVDDSEPAATRPQTKAIKRKHDALRATLKSAATDALGQVDEQTAGKPAPPARSAQAKPTAAGAGMAGFRPTRTTPPSDEKKARLFLLAVPAIILLLVGGAWLALRPSPAEQALTAFQQPVPAARLAAPLRHQTMLDRTWLRTLDGERSSELVLGLDQARFQPIQRLPLADLHQWWKLHLEGLELHRELCCWLQPGAAAFAEQVLAKLKDPGDRGAWASALQQAGQRIVRYEEIPVLLTRAGFGDIQVYAVSLLLGGTAVDSDPAQLLQGTTGAAELSVFTGSQGRVLQPAGDGYVLTGPVAYWGILMQVPPAIHPLGGSWRILVLRTGTLDPAALSDERNPLVARARNLVDDLRSRRQRQQLQAARAAGAEIERVSP